METLERGARPPAVLAPDRRAPTRSAAPLERRPPRHRTARRVVSRRHLVRASLRGQATGDYRPDIEGLRAVAVIAVVLFHTRLLGVHGGFVGVDVFFVLSGFLITRLLLGELERSGTISLRSFWARRARRLLPAAALVAVATLFATRLVLTPLARRAVAGDAVSAATFTSNFRFAHRLGDYFGAQLGALAPSPLLHFWSLAVEEQFYLCWPLVLVLLARRPRQYRRLVLSTIVTLAIGGFLVSAWLTPRNPAAAFYLLPARSGELLAGAALAAAGPAFRAVPAAWRAAAGWLGVLGIVVAVLTYTEQMPFPGTATILPVAATMLVIVAGGAGSAPWAPQLPLGAPGMRWIGRHSYALYLWHWPLLVLAEARWGALGWPVRILLIGFSVALSAASVRLVEDPVRHAPWLAAAPRRGLVLGAALCTLVAGGGTVLASSGPRLDGGTVAAAPVLAVPVTSPAVAAALAPVSVPPGTAPPPTSAAAADAPATTLATPDPPAGPLAALVGSMQRVLGDAARPAPVPSNLRPSLGRARVRSKLYDDGCVNVGVNAKLQPCEYGVRGSDRLMVLYGDSHAAQWFEAVEPIAIAHGYRLVVLTKGGCPLGTVEVSTPILKFTCPAWRDRAIAWMAEHHPALVVATNSYTQYSADAATWAAGVDEGFRELASVAPNLVVIGDNPASRQDSPACLSGHLADASACATARQDAVRPDRIAAEVSTLRAIGARFVDTTDWFCAPDSCPAVIGDILVLRDPTHLTAPAVEFVRPLLEAALAPAL